MDGPGRPGDGRFSWRPAHADRAWAAFPAPFNEKLSESRAQAARDFLVSQGVAPDAIVSKGFGADHPVADNGTEAGRQENRRVELVVTGEGLTAPAETTAPAPDPP